MGFLRAIGVIAALGLMFAVVVGFAVYVYPRFPYLLLMALICEWGFGIAAVIGIFNAARYSTFMTPGEGVSILAAIYFGNAYVMFLAGQWDVDISGWPLMTLQFEAGVLAYVGHFFGALIQAVFHLPFDPLTRAVRRMMGGFNGELELPRLGGGVVAWSGKLLAQVVLGVLSGVISAIVLRRWFGGGR